MANQVTLTFAGDAGDLVKESRKASEATEGVAASANEASQDVTRAAGSTSDLTTRMGSLGAASAGASDAIGNAAGTMQALVDIQQAGERKAAEHAQALEDVQQASRDADQAMADLRQSQLDLNQAFVDGKQATLDADQALIDVKQAALDAKTAQTDYNAAVKEHGKGSAEAEQAAIDLKQAQQDLKQANLDGEQATADGAQALADAKQATLDAAQANGDAKQAQLDLNEAQRAANPPDMQKWADQLNLIAPLVMGLTGIVALVTAAQWAWNIAMTMNPIGLVVVAIGVLIAIIVVIATKTDWFQRLWRTVWGGIKAAASAVGSWFVNTLWRGMILRAWNGITSAGASVLAWFRLMPSRIASALRTVASAVTAPFRMAFNFVARAWNNTVGRLSWSVPGWIPFIGGNSISAPRLPTFHRGGIVPGMPGSEMLAVLQAGEKVTPVGQSGGNTVIQVQGGGRGTTAEQALATAVLHLFRVGAISLTVNNGKVSVA